MAKEQGNYPVNFDVKYPNKLDRFTSFFRLLWSIPIIILLSALTSSGWSYAHEANKHVAQSGGDIMVGLTTATALMIIFRERYPRWWYDFMLELNRFSARVGAYVFLLTDRYPSTVEKQSVTLDLVYPDVEKDLNRWLPLVK